MDCGGCMVLLCVCVCVCLRTYVHVCVCACACAQEASVFSSVLILRSHMTSPPPFCFGLFLNIPCAGWFRGTFPSCMRVCMRVSSYDVSVAFTAFVFLSLLICCFWIQLMNYWCYQRNCFCAQQKLLSFKHATNLISLVFGYCMCRSCCNKYRVVFTPIYLMLIW